MSKLKAAFIQGAQQMLDRLTSDDEFRTCFPYPQEVIDVLESIINVGDDKLTDIVTVRSFKGLAKDLDLSGIGGRNNPLRGLKDIEKAFVAVFDASGKAPGALAFVGAAETENAILVSGNVSVPKQPDEIRQQLLGRFQENGLDAAALRGNDLRALDFIDDMAVEIYNQNVRRTGGGLGGLRELMEALGIAEDDLGDNGPFKAAARRTLH